VIVPENGGATSYARHERNCLVVDTSSPAQCWEALNRLIRSTDLKTQLSRHAIKDICDYFPERAALNILNVLFDSEHSSI
jgi:hypothetical protein